MRAAGTDENISLTPPLLLSLERGLEIMRGDELLEVTPSSVRLRKQFLKESDRKRGKIQA
jgi:GTP-binding protein